MSSSATHRMKATSKVLRPSTFELSMQSKDQPSCSTAFSGCVFCIAFLYFPMLPFKSPRPQPRRSPWYHPRGRFLEGRRGPSTLAQGLGFRVLEAPSHPYPSHPQPSLKPHESLSSINLCQIHGVNGTGPRCTATCGMLSLPT